MNEFWRAASRVARGVGYDEYGFFACSWPVVPRDVDPQAHLKDDGIWQFRTMPLPYESVDRDSYSVPCYAGDVERLAWEARVRRFYRRPRWLLEHGVYLGPVGGLRPVLSERIDLSEKIAPLWGWPS
jgi:hypothetical protein